MSNFIIPYSGFTSYSLSNNITRYVYDDINVLSEIIADIEKRGLIIIKDNEKKRWIDATTEENFVKLIQKADREQRRKVNEETFMTQLSNEISTEIDNEILNKLIEYNEEEKRLRNKYSKFKTYLKKPPFPINEENIPSYEEWLKHDGVKNKIDVSNDDL